MSSTVIVHLFAHPGHLSELRAYEARVLPLLEDHGGRLEMAFEPSRANSTFADLPDEVHILTFPSTEAWQNLTTDSRYAGLAAQRQAAIRKTQIVVADSQVPYD